MAKPQKRRKREERPDSRNRRKKVCMFCVEKEPPTIDYKDVALLRKFMSDRAKIRGRRVTGNCVQHQSAIATAIKNSREMALLPYISTSPSTKRRER